MQILEHLKKKDSPFFVLDTHSGIGLYKLNSEQAQKTKEAEKGIQSLINLNPKNELLVNYINLVKEFNQSGDINAYPGSPAITAKLIRQQDRFIANELHPEDYKTLCDYSASLYTSFKVLNIDAYQAMRANIPPKEKRGLILIDPPFEEKDEFATLTKQLQHALPKWGHGIFMIWFPLKAHLPISNFYNDIKLLNIPKTLLIECFIEKPTTPEKLTGCGLIIMNTPWKIDENIINAKKDLETAICPSHVPGINVKWIVE